VGRSSPPAKIGIDPEVSSSFSSLKKFVARALTSKDYTVAMRFSLRSRFRGAFLGTALGQVFATIALSQTHQPDQDPSLKPLRFAPLHPARIWQAAGAIDLTSLRERNAGGRVAIQQTRNLIEPQVSSRIDPFSKPTSAIEFLPLILFCHESPEQLQHLLMPRLAECSAALQTEVLLLGAIVSLMLKEQFLPDSFPDSSTGATVAHRLIPLLLERRQFPFVEDGTEQDNEQDNGLADQLCQIQFWLVEQTPLSMLPAVSLSPTVAALYSVLKTPASFQISLLHTLRLSPDPTAAALAGLLAGTYLSEAGLPIGWRYALDRHPSALLQTLWDVSATAKLLDLADRLWAGWSGAFQPHNWKPSPSTVTAIPRLVRPR
jgi:hypothetical protein